MTVLVDTIQRELDARRALREHLDQEITTLDRMLQDRLALALGESRDDIADACGALLLDDQVVLNPDHTYRTAGSTTTRQGGGTTPMNPTTNTIEQIVDRLVRASKDEIIYQAEKAGTGAAAADVAIRGLLAAGTIVDTAGVLHRPVQLVA